MAEALITRNFTEELESLVRNAAVLKNVPPGDIATTVIKFIILMVSKSEDSSLLLYSIIMTILFVVFVVQIVCNMTSKHFFGDEKSLEQSWIKENKSAICICGWAAIVVTIIFISKTTENIYSFITKLELWGAKTTLSGYFFISILIMLWKLAKQCVMKIWSVPLEYKVILCPAIFPALHFLTELEIWNTIWDLHDDGTLVIILFVMYLTCGLVNWYLKGINSKPEEDSEQETDQTTRKQTTEEKEKNYTSAAATWVPEDDFLNPPEHEILEPDLLHDLSLHLTEYAQM